MLTSLILPDGLPSEHAGFIDSTGVTRILNLHAPKPKLFAPRLADTIPLIPRSDWQPTTRLADLGSRVVRYDQGQVGQCEPTSETEAVCILRGMANLPTVRLSNSFLYAQINGGVDGGAGIGDGFPVLQSIGICLEKTVPSGFYTRRQIPAAAYKEAALYRALKAYHCPTFDEAVTAHLNGMVVVHGVAVGNRFNNLDKNHVYPVTRGAPNHAVTFMDLVALPGGDWGMDDLNHWGMDWGNAGRFVTSEACYDALSYQDAIAYEVVSVDADVVGPPPAVKAA